MHRCWDARGAPQERSESWASCCPRQPLALSSASALPMLENARARRKPRGAAAAVFVVSRWRVAIKSAATVMSLRVHRARRVALCARTARVVTRAALCAQVVCKAQMGEDQRRINVAPFTFAQLHRQVAAPRAPSSIRVCRCSARGRACAMRVAGL